MPMTRRFASPRVQAGACSHIGSSAGGAGAIASRHERDRVGDSRIPVRGAFDASGEDAIYFDASKNRYVGAVSLGFGPDAKRARRKVSGRTRPKSGTS
jgi:hypothetical protein